MICSEGGRAGTRIVCTSKKASSAYYHGFGFGWGKEGRRTLWRGPGAVVEEGEVKVVIYTAIRGEHSHLWSRLIIGFRCARSQCQDVASLQTIRQARSRTCNDAVSGSGRYC